MLKRKRKVEAQKLLKGSDFMKYPCLHHNHLLLRMILFLLVSVSCKFLVLAKSLKNHLMKYAVLEGARFTLWRNARILIRIDFKCHTVQNVCQHHYKLWNIPRLPSLTTVRSRACGNANVDTLTWGSSILPELQNRPGGALSPATTAGWTCTPRWPAGPLTVHWKDRRRRRKRTLTAAHLEVCVETFVVCNLLTRLKHKELKCFHRDYFLFCEMLQISINYIYQAKILTVESKQLGG